MPRRGRPRYQYDAGRERALEHIRQAKLLSMELGGTDKDVKAYFFSLPAGRLGTILEQYGRLHGERAKAYAEDTIGKWRSGRTQMSGMVAERLYSLLPPYMPLSEKFDLIKSLWQHVCPSTHKVVRIGPDADPGEINATVLNYVTETVQSYCIQDGLTKRFNWLAAGDAQVHQQLLNQLLQMEKMAAVHATSQHVPVFLKHIQTEGQLTHRLARIMEIGKHKVELLFDANASGVRLENPQLNKPVAASVSSSGSGLFWLVAIAVVAAIIYFANQ